MADFLANMADASRARSAADQDKCSLLEMRAAALASPAPRPIRPCGSGFLMIAEVKLASPSEGALAAAGDASATVRAQAAAYAEGRASLLSVLTEPTVFGGAAAHVAEAAAAASGIAIMRKDFLTDSYQVYQARVLGASAVLLIMRMLSDDTLAMMLLAADDCDLAVILECFDVQDIERVAALVDCEVIVACADDPQSHPKCMVGINTRDLASLAVVPDRLATLAPILASRIGSRLPWIAESGMHSAADVAAACRLGYRGVLVGTALMRAASPVQACRELIVAGAAARAGLAHRIKICGVRDVATARHALKAGANAIGLVFARSPRQVSTKDAAQIAAVLQEFVGAWLVGVWKELDAVALRQVLAKASLTHIQADAQYHAVFAEAASTINGERPTWLPVYRLIDDAAVDSAVADLAAHVLVEGAQSGIGQHADAERVLRVVAQRSRRGLGTITAGGHTPQNIRAHIRAHADACSVAGGLHRIGVGVDVSSGVERELGRKDFGLVTEFIAQAKSGLSELKVLP